MGRFSNPGMSRQLKEKDLLHDALYNVVAMEGLCPALKAFSPRHDF